MARFPQVDWVAVNGRDTPFTKPQHYKEGSTSETDLTGHDNPLPTTDKSVRAELESIKATQDKILKRLDEPLPTQLTGSNVEDAESIPVRSTRRLVAYKQVESERVPALSYFYLTPNVEKAVDNFNEFILLLRWEDDPTDFDFVVTYYHAPNQFRVVAEDTYKIDDLGKSISLKSPYFRVYVRNKDDVERMIKFAIVTGR